MKQIILNRKSSVKHPCLGFEHVLAFEWKWISSTLQWPNCFAFFGRKHHWIKVDHQQHLSLPKGRWWFAKSFLAAVLLTHVFLGILIGLNKNHSRHAPSGIHIHGPQHVCRYSGGGGSTKEGEGKHSATAGPCQTARCFGLLSASTRESKDWSIMTIKINARVIWKHDIIHILQTYIIYLEKQKMKPHFVKIKTAWKGGNHPKGFNVWWFWGVTLRYGHRPPGEPPNICFKRWPFMIGIGTVVCSMQS